VSLEGFLEGFLDVFDFPQGYPGERKFRFCDVLQNLHVLPFGESVKRHLEPFRTLGTLWKRLFYKCLWELENWVNIIN